jgi:hypothetical protein
MTTTKKIKIALSDASPVSIDPGQWPIIARADWHDGEIEVQANTQRTIRVREHADGRRIVYGRQFAGEGGQYAGTRNPEAGYLIGGDAKELEEQTVRAIRRVAGAIGDDDLGAECIGELPAREI